MSFWKLLDTFNQPKYLQLVVVVYLTQLKQFYFSNRDKGCLSNYFAGTCDLSGSESIPVVTVPTTAGSGAEVTLATIWDDQANIKRSIDDIRIQPKECISDPSFKSTKRIIAVLRLIPCLHWSPYGIKMHHQ